MAGCGFDGLLFFKLFNTLSMKHLLCFCFFALLSSSPFVFAQTGYLHYPTDSITIIDIFEGYFDVPITNIEFEQPKHGVVTLLPELKFQYTANSMTEAAYPDNFLFTVYSYQFSYLNGGSIVPIFDTPMPNVPPLNETQINYLCRDKAYPYPPSFPLTITDANNDDYNYVLLQEPLHGTVTIANTCLSNYELIYQPDAGFVGVDSMIYRACESNTIEQYCTDVLRIIHVQNCEAVPFLANDDDYFQLFLSPATFTPLENDYADNLPVTISITEQGIFGTVVVNPDNSITYHANNTNVFITEQLHYLICDDFGNCSDTATIILTNVPPTWYFNDPYYVTVNTPADESVEISFLSDRLGCEVYQCLDTINSLLQYGSIAITPNGKYIYTPFEDIAEPQQSGELEEQIPYHICTESIGGSKIVLLIKLIFPVCISDTTTVNYQTPIHIAVLSNDLSADTLNITAINIYPQHGISAIRNNKIWYQPNTAYTGNDSLQYVACDPYNNCDTATVFITVVPDSAIGIASVFANIPLSTQLRVYPNPTRELLNIVVAPDQQIQNILFTDMMGRRLLSPALPDSVGHRAAVSVQHLPEGLYLVEVQTNVGVGVQRVMVR